MKSLKKIVLILILILLCTSCSDISNKLIDDKDSDDINIDEKLIIDVENDEIIIAKFNLSAIDDNDNKIATDGKQIYYINPADSFIYKINLDGTDNELISEHKTTRLIYYNEKLYFNEYSQVNSFISCINKDGSNYRVVYNDKQSFVFTIHDDIIYMRVLVGEQDAGYVYSFYRYNLLDGNVEIFDDSVDLPRSLGICVINDKVYYNIEDRTREYDPNTNTTKDYNISIHNMQEYNNYIYSYSRNYILRSEIDNITKFDKIFELSGEYIIKRISVIDDLIFLSYIYDYNYEDEKDAYVDVINIDGTNQRNLFKFKYSTLGHYPFEKIYVLNDRLIVISTDSEYPIFKIFDFEGKELWSLY